MDVYIFRRDLRIEDNPGFYKSVKANPNICPVFIADPRQLDKNLNKYYCENSVKFMFACLFELKKKLPSLTILYGDPVDVLKKSGVKKISFTADYTKFSIERDKELCYNFIHDVYHFQGINTPLSIKPYKVFTPYYNYALSISDYTIYKTPNTDNCKKLLSNNQNYTHEKFNDVSRNLAIKRLKYYKGSYEENRNSCAETTRLSAYIKFGVLSAKELVYLSKKYMKKSDADLFIKQLYWRDFYLQIMYHFDVVNKEFKPIKWKWYQDMDVFNKWATANTGIPIIDAGITELLTTGYMHNRLRMIVANFLTMVLNIDWRLGERFFATHLIDYDISNNNGGWQWCAGCGADAMQYFRMFNPYLQQKKFDPECLYIKRFLPNRYKNLSKKEIHNIRSEIFDYDKLKLKALKRMQ